MRKVAMPKLEKRVPPAFTPQDIEELLAGCDCKKAMGARNYAIVLSLLDTGLRASEFASLHVGDVDMRSGLAMVFGKGQKQRTVRAGAKARTAILHMLAFRDRAEDGDPLWAAYGIQGRETGALSVHGLQSMLVRLGRKVGVVPCAPHRFRRTFALWMLRDGCDLHSLRMLMGHSSLAVLQRYLDLAGEDIERAHMAHSPGDRLLSKARSTWMRTA
jgi:integrase/recombinase XerC/integrase/recombinase XerD